MSHRMMSMPRKMHCFCCAISLFFIISGCSVHPLIDDVTPLNTVAVVNKLRCEIRAAIKKELSDLVERDPIFLDNPEQAKRLISDIKTEAPRWKENLRNKLSKESNTLIDRYDGALIFMDFTFMNTEDNNNDANLNILSTLVRGSDALNIKASNNRKRSSTRTFRTQDSFTGILDVSLSCDGQSHHPDYLYPVTGEIGLYEIIDTFLQLNEGRSLIEGVPKDRLFADTLAFSTTLSGTLGPQITLSPVGKAVSLADASFTSTNTRTDVHTVIVGLSLPLEPLIVATPIKGSKSLVFRRETVSVKQPKFRQAEQLNGFIDDQVQRNLIMQLPTTLRPVTIPLF